MWGIILACVLECTGSGFTLYLNDQPLSWPGGALTLEQCEEMLEEIDKQAEPFANLRCVEEPFARQDI
jgi:hypothetical protein